MMQISQASHQCGFLSGRLTVHGVLLGGERSAKPKRYQDAYHDLHGGPPRLTCRALIPEILHPHEDGQMSGTAVSRRYCFLPKISRSRAVVCAAGSLRILRSSWPIT